jgi:hypothetical protein
LVQVYDITGTLLFEVEETQEVEAQLAFCTARYNPKENKQEVLGKTRSAVGLVTLR